MKIYEEQMYADIHSIAVSLKEITAILLEQRKEEINTSENLTDKALVIMMRKDVSPSEVLDFDNYKDYYSIAKEKIAEPYILKETEWLLVRDQLDKRRK